MGERVLGESDWEDDDLLSIDEAVERIDDEIALGRSQLEHCEDGLAVEERSRLKGRLGALQEARRRLTSHRGNGSEAGSSDD